MIPNRRRNHAHARYDPTDYNAPCKQAWAQRAQKDGRDLSGWVRFIANREAAAS